MVRHDVTFLASTCHCADRIGAADFRFMRDGGVTVDGRKLYQERRRKGLTLTRLAELARVSDRTIMRMERGEHVGLTSVRKVDEALRNVPDLALDLEDLA